MSLLLVAVLTLVGCRKEVVDTGSVDQDGDGYLVDQDCDDLDSAVHPDVVEVCDGVDNNCDGQVDESGLNGSTFYADQDGDGYGDPLSTQILCAAEEGWVANSLDCEDADPTASPVGTEVCDGMDNDCDGDVDEADAADAGDWFFDGDGDGYGDGTLVVQACQAPANYVGDERDCDDANPFASPGRDELCATPYDDDCDGTINESDAADATEWFPDVDGDGYGLPSTGVYACLAPAAAADNDLDCDDGDAAVNPAAVEVCDGVDNDCDGGADGSDAQDALSWYADTDGDGYGDPSALVLSCQASLSGYVPDAQDCDDGDSAVNPTAVEVCDGVDNDCEGSVDGSDAADAATWYYDGDSDSYGLDSSTTQSCSAPSGYAADGGDCDDGDSSVSPAASEVCDSVDNDCDGDTDEDDAVDASTWYVDADSDGEGVSTATLTQCDQPSGYVSNATDCDDSDADLNSTTVWYYDADLDGYGVASSTRTQCADPGSFFVRDAGDCRPGDASDYPGADEYCDSVDNDCDGDTDEDDAVDAATWYSDADGDSYGDAASTTLSCSLPSGYVADDSDCDDSDASITDSQTWYLDADGDGEGLSSSTTESCTEPSGYVSTAGDCDDSDATLNSSTRWYYDADLDGYGTTGSASYTRCVDPGLYYVQDNTDCEPFDADSYPGATEECLSGTSADGVDNDCDGSVDEDCPEIHCGTISTDETWSASTEHLITCNVYVQSSSSPVLTIDAGTTVSFNSNLGLYVGYSYDGDIQVNGTSGNPVLFTSSSSSPAAGDYLGLLVMGSASASTLDYLQIEYGGSSTSFPGALYVGSADLVAEGLEVYDSDQNGIYVTGGSLLLTDSIIQDNAEDGVFLAGTGTLDASASFTDNILTGNGGYPMVLNPEDVAQLDSSSTFTGNGDDRIYVRGATIDQDTTWAPMDADYLLDGQLYVQSSGVAPVWTIQDGVDIQVANLSGIWVGYSSGGEVDIQGTSAGVSITSGESSPAAGDWYGLILGSKDRDSSIEGLELAHGGASASWPGTLYVQSDASVTDSDVHDSERNGIYAASGAAPTITNTLVEDNGEDGVYVHSSGALGGAFTGNTLSGNVDSPVTLPANYAGMLDSSSAYTGNGLDVARLIADTVDADATWQLLDVPMQLDGSVYVQGSATPVLTVEDGATLLVSAGYGLYVGYSAAGAIALEGNTTTGTGILLSSAQSSPAAGDWVGLVLGSQARAASTTLEGFTVEYAGYSSGFPGGVYVNGSDVTMSDCLVTESALYGVYAANAEITVTDCEVSDNSSHGLYLVSSAGLGGAFADNVVTGNGGYPVAVAGNYLGLLDDSSTYTGNSKDYIYVFSDTVSDDATWLALDVDYYVAGTQYIQAAGGVSVDTDGANFYFGSGITLHVGNSAAGAFQATNALFTSAQSSPAAGDWYGIRFGYYATDAQCKITGSTISYGGATYGNIHLYYTNATVTGNTISDSGTYGIYAYGSPSATVSGNSYASNASGDTYGL